MFRRSKIAFTARQNVENEHIYTLKKQAFKLNIFS